MQKTSANRTFRAPPMDPGLLGSLIDRHAAALELYARQWCDTPEDVVQEAFVKLATERWFPDEPAAWLYRVVRNSALNAGRAARTRYRHERAAAEAAPPYFDPDPSGPIDPGAAEAALKGLPADQREVVVARLWGGLSFEQVAALVGGSSSSAHRTYHRALDTLRERLGVTWQASATRPHRS